MTRKRVALLVTAAVLVPVLVVGLALFQPWRLFTHKTVNEALPEVPAPAASLAPSGTGAVPAAPKPGPVTLASGVFRSGEHHTSGTASVIRLADGSRIVRLTDFDTSDGPDVHVILSDQPAGSSDHAVDKGRYVKLGKLKGTRGNQNYPIPAGADLTQFASVVIWCDRFNATFGSADLN
jgi:hypothetical protein